MLKSDTFRSALTQTALFLVFPLVILLLWQVLGARAGAFWVSSPALVGTRLWEWIGTGEVFAHLGTTALEVVIGYAVGATLAVAAGLALYFAPVGREIVLPYLSSLYSIPKVALAPLFVIFLGIGYHSKLMLVAYAVFFVVFLNTVEGTKQLDRALRRTMTLMGATEFEYFLKVVAPSSVVWIISGLRVSIRYAITAAVVAEIVSSNRGVGYLIQHYADSFDTTGVFAALISLLSIGLILNFILTRVEAWFSIWKE